MNVTTAITDKPTGSETRKRIGKRTNPVGKKSVRVNASVPVEVREELEKLAARQGVGISTYCRRVLTHAAQAKATYEEKKMLIIERKAESDLSSAPTPAAQVISGDEPLTGRPSKRPGK